VTQPTFVGKVGAVSGASINVRLSEGVASGISIIGGRSYRVAQVGNFVRIPQGYHHLYGIVSEVGASATPEAIKDINFRGERWMRVELVGEIVDVSFERGISQYPTINDDVHLVTEEELNTIYDEGAAEGQVIIGRLSGAESIPVRVDLDKLVTRHSAVLGSTGSGKSTTVASLLRSIAGANNTDTLYPNSRILIIDVHGEYSPALRNLSKIFKVSPASGEYPLFVPYWAIETGQLLSFLMGRLEDKALTAISDKIVAAKYGAALTGNFGGADVNSLTVETPLPFSIKQLWLDLIDPEVKTWSDTARTQAALVLEGSADKLIVPKYKPAGAGSSPPFINSFNVLSIRRQLDQMRSRLLDKQYDFMLHPGGWEPDESGVVNSDLGDLLESWLGHSKAITVLDLSGVPSSVLLRLIGGILNIIYEALFWGRETPEGGRERPLLIVMEEAHRYLNRESDNPARAMAQRIVKEGRKFGVGAMIVSQRPSEIDETILSQCGTFFALRMSNAADRGKVQAALSDNLTGLVESLPVLRTGELIVTGEAARLPIRCRVNLPPEEERPNSEDPKVAKAWAKGRGKENYGILAGTWRSQNSKWIPKKEDH
jgi:hypothetical protein